MVFEKMVFGRPSAPRSYIFTICLPTFPPLIIDTKAAGSASIPSATVSAAIRLPAATLAVSSAAASRCSSGVAAARRRNRSRLMCRALCSFLFSVVGAGNNARGTVIL